MKNKVTQLKTLAHPGQHNIKRIVIAGVCVLAVLASMYMYFVGKIVFDVVGRRTAEASIRSSQSAIGTLASNYFSRMKTLDLAQAQSMGLSVSHEALYASRAVTTAKTVGMAHEI